MEKGFKANFLSVFWKFFFSSMIKYLSVCYIFIPSRLFCSVVYPKCNATSTLYDLPCQECCLGIQNRICEKQWTQILRNEDVFFKTSVIPDCSVLPKKTGSVLCSFPQFITSKNFIFQMTYGSNNSLEHFEDFKTHNKSVKQLDPERSKDSRQKVGKWDWERGY